MGLLQTAVFKEVQEKALGEILGVMWSRPATACESVQGVPIKAAKFSQSSLTSWHPTFRGNKNRAPARGAKARWIIRHRQMLRIHLNFPTLFPWIDRQFSRENENRSNSNA